MWKWSHSVVSDSLRPYGCSPPGSSIHGILQARILEWVAISFPRGSSQPWDRSRVSRIAGRRFTVWATREVQSTWRSIYLLLNNHLCFDDSQICSSSFNFLFPSRIPEVQAGSFAFLTLLCLKHNESNSQFSLSNHSCLFHPGFILEPPSPHFPQLESYLIASCSLPLSYHWFFLSEDFYLPLHLCFCCSPNTSGLEFDNWITVTYLASSLKSLSLLGHWIHGAKASRLLYHLAKKKTTETSKFHHSLASPYLFKLASWTFKYEPWVSNPRMCHVSLSLHPDPSRT